MLVKYIPKYNIFNVFRWQFNDGNTFSDYERIGDSEFDYIFSNHDMLSIMLYESIIWDGKIK